jgi:alpha-mannosidase
MASLQPAALRLLALKRAEAGKGYVVRVQNPTAKPVEATLTWKQIALPLGPVRSGQIASWLLRPAGLGWSAMPVDLAENPLVAAR